MGLPTLETERLILRPSSLDDIDALHQVWTDPEVRRYLWDDEVISRQRAAAAVETAVADANRNGVGLWCVLPKPASALAGFCGFRYIDDSPDIELVYGLLPDYWGQGLATEAARAVLEYGFDAAVFTRIYGRTDVADRASIRVMERLGMKLGRETRLAARPTLIYSLTRVVGQFACPGAANPARQCPTSHPLPSLTAPLLRWHTWRAISSSGFSLPVSQVRDSVGNGGMGMIAAAPLRKRALRRARQRRRLQPGAGVSAGYRCWEKSSVCLRTIRCCHSSTQAD
jgi:RimJ/RimL family protein N-acetyltransferase